MTAPKVGTRPVEANNASEPALTLETFLPYRLNRLAELVSHALSRIYAEQYEISIPEWRIVATLGQFHTMTARDIGKHSKMNKTKVSRATASLEAKDIIRRAPNPEDMREAFLALSPAGRKMYSAIVPDALEFNASLLSILNREECGDLDKLVVKLTKQASILENRNTKGTRKER
jgi:DNA-binding MarR family transcriptional regulator